MFDGAPSWSLGASETGESQNAREAVGLIASRWRGGKIGTYSGISCFRNGNALLVEVII